VAERGLGQDKREGGERKERSGLGLGARQQPNLELQHLLVITSIYQWPMESTTHTPKKYFHSIHCTVSMFTLQNQIQFLTEF
jgi:hypothetical protein